MKFRNIRVKMKGGKSRIQRAMVLASGKLKFVKNVTRSKSSRKARHNPNSGGKTRKMVRRRKTHHSRRSRKIPLAPIGGLFYGLTQGWGGGNTANSLMSGNFPDALKQLATSLGFNAYENRIDLMRASMLKGLLVGGLIHMGASKLGVNRAIQKVPLVNI